MKEAHPLLVEGAYAGDHAESDVCNVAIASLTYDKHTKSQLRVHWSLSLYCAPLDKRMF